MCVSEMLVSIGNTFLYWDESNGLKHTVALHSSSGAADKQPALDGLPSWQDENIDSAYSLSPRDTAEGGFVSEGIDLVFIDDKWMCLCPLRLSRHVY